MEQEKELEYRPEEIPEEIAIPIPGDIDFKKKKEVTERLVEAVTSKPKEIKILLINANVHISDALFLYDLIRNLEIPTTVAAIGSCDTEELIILQAGTKRRISKHGIIIVRPSHKQAIEILAEKSGKSVEEIKKLSKRGKINLVQQKPRNLDWLMKYFKLP